jgi:uncharacterized membrane protein YobD (UPF0266 family)
MRGKFVSSWVIELLSSLSNCYVHVFRSHLRSLKLVFRSLSFFYFLSYKRIHQPS